MYMTKNKNAGFIPLIIALIVALSIGGGVIAYKSHEKKEALKVENKESVEVVEVNNNLKIRATDDQDYGENHPEKFGGDGYEDEDEDEVKTDVKVTTPPVKLPPIVASYTMAEVKAHNSSASCWTIVNGSVYDVTSWITKHPGGAGAIKGMCGVDGSAAFNGQHGGQARPASELASFKIGVLK